MSNDNGNKLAHPCAPEGYEPEFGLTKREYFAAMAMQAIISKLPVIDQTGEFGVPVDDKVQYNLDVADSAIQMADALLAALEAGDE